MKALVTGASGFVGRHLVAALEHAGDEVIGVDRHQGGVDIPDAGAVPGAARPSAGPRSSTTWPAGPTSVGRGAAPVETFRVNAEGTLNVLQACRRGRRASGCSSVGSADVYGQVAEAELPAHRGRRRSGR